MAEVNFKKKVIFPSNRMSEIIAFLVEKGLKFYPDKNNNYILGIGTKEKRLKYGIHTLHGLLQVLEIEKDKMFGIIYFFNGRKKLKSIKILANAFLKEHNLSKKDIKSLFSLYGFDF